MMRRSSLILISCLATALFGEGAAAQSFGWLFGGPPRSARASRTRHRATPPHAAIPLPVPRPHFASDAPTSPAATAAATPTTPTPTATPEPSAAANAPAVSSSPPVAPAPERSGSPPLPPPKPADLAVPSAPAPVAPSQQAAVAPSGATNAFMPRQPAADAGCLDRLKSKKADAEPIAIGKQPDERCTVVQPVTLRALTLSDGRAITFPDRPVIACTTADTFTAYVHDLLAPLAQGSYGAPLSSVWTGPGFECRSRDHIFGAKLSAHGQGLAVDIAQLKLADGRTMEVGTPKDAAEAAFETAARAGACGYFHTVLGPGSDAYHRTHWHFDLEVRGREGDSKYCK